MNGGKTSKKPKIKESVIQKQIIDYLTIKKYKVIKFNNVGIYKQSTGTYIPSRQAGVSDLLVCSPTGQFIAIEVKSGYNKPTENQLEFIEEIKSHNGIGFVAWTLDDVINNLE